MTAPSPRPRVLFVAPGNQVGHDGITDYTFWLAAAAGRSGADCTVFTFFPCDDTLANLAARFPATGSGRLTVECARSGPLGKRLERLAETCRAFAPDWISLQFTPGTYRAGRYFLPGMFRLARTLRYIAPLCLTVHETHRVLIAANDSWRSRIRRFEINTGLLRLRPAKVFCSNPLHCADLAAIGFEPQLLPVVSNIPVAATAIKIPGALGGTGSVRSVLGSHTSNRTARRPSLPFHAGASSGVLDPQGIKPAGPVISPPMRIALFFGRIDTSWNPRTVLAALAAESVETGDPITLVSIGEVGHGGLGWRRVEETAKALGLGVHQAGPLPPDEISAWMQHAACGLTSTPSIMWRKSSACAAMLLHGLPIVFPDEPPETDLPLPPKFAVVRNGKLRWLDAPAGRQARPVTADDLWRIMDLQAASTRRSQR